MGPEIIKAKGEAKVGVVIHAEHYNAPLTTEKKILWNNYYDYQFENARSIDFSLLPQKFRSKFWNDSF